MWVLWSLCYWYCRSFWSLLCSLAHVFFKTQVSGDVHRMSNDSLAVVLPTENKPRPMTTVDSKGFSDAAHWSKVFVMTKMSSNRGAPAFAAVPLQDSNVVRESDVPTHSLSWFETTTSAKSKDFTHIQWTDSSIATDAQPIAYLVSHMCWTDRISSIILSSTQILDTSTVCWMF